jgi:hypothetical protein
MSPDERPDSPPADGEGPLPPRRSELDSITDVHGSVAHFEMAYEAPTGERRSFGPPFRERLPSLLFLGIALALCAVTFAGYNAAPGTKLYRWIPEGDKDRPFSASGLAFIVLLSAIATTVRAHLRGVVVHADGIEARYLLPLGFPRVRRWTWAQVHRVIASHDAVAFELWDGTYERLPAVAQNAELTRMLIGIATSRKVPVTRLE